jgi:hypothetical protein
VTAWLPALAALGAAGWVAVIVTTPGLPTPVAALVYLLGSAICHQLPGRSFHIAGFQLPVCARCLGIYAGAALGGLVACRSIGVRRATGRGRMGVEQRGRARAWMMLGAMPTATTVLLESAGVWPGSNLVRAMAGVPLGAVVGFIVTATAGSTRRQAHGPVA